MENNADPLPLLILKGRLSIAIKKLDGWLRSQKFLPSWVCCVGGMKGMGTYSCIKPSLLKPNPTAYHGISPPSAVLSLNVIVFR